jgi:tRNA-dihydrouridine synthase B
VRIPVVANGDLLRPEDAPAMLAASGADAVMIGRGACGRPWIVGQAVDVLSGLPPAPAPFGEALREIVLEHYAMILSHYGIGKGVRIARKHIGWYFDHLEHAVPAALRGAIMQGEDSRQVERLLTSALAPAEVAAA